MTKWGLFSAQGLICCAFFLMFASSAKLSAQPGTNIGDTSDTAAGPLSIAIEARNRELALRSVQQLGKAGKPDMRASKALIERVTEDFKELQVIRFEMVTEIRAGRPFQYDKLSADTEEIKKRAARLRVSLALLERSGEEEVLEKVTFDAAAIQDAASQLCIEISGFIENPMFKPNRVYNPRYAAEADKALKTVITLAANIRASARNLKP